MLILTTPTIEGKKIVEYYGLVSGDSLLGAKMFIKICSQELEMWLGAEPPNMKKNLPMPGNWHRKVWKKRQKKGANEIVGTRVAYHNLGGTWGTP